MKKYLIIGLIAVLFSFNAKSEIVEKQKITISNDFVVVSNATFGSATIGGKTITNFNSLLPKAGGTMTGDIDFGGKSGTNANILSVTNYIWLPVGGTVYFGTTTNYIVDQNGTNFGFKIGTNDLINFGI